MLLKNKTKKYLVIFLVILGLFSFPFKNTQAQELRIISRAQWGADESFRFDANGEDKWPEECAPVKKFIIHHSGTTLKDNDKNGVVDQQDYQSTIRAIYNWHAQVLNWGDIGYNYLIDPLGNIYQGRYLFNRAKTGRSYSVKIFPEAQDHLQVFLETQVFLVLQIVQDLLQAPPQSHSPAQLLQIL